MNNISFTIPLERSVLISTAAYLENLAVELGNDVPVGQAAVKPVSVELPVNPLVSTTAFDDQFAPEPVNEGAAIFGGGDPNVLSPAPTVVVAGQTTDNVAQPAHPSTAPTTGVELDADGLPWDVRIHSLSATGEHPKLAKTKQWKKKRNVEKNEPGLVEQVEAELRQLMALPAPVVTETVAPAPVVTETVAPAPVVTETVAPAPAATVIELTFASLMGKITGSGIKPEVVAAACSKVGIASPVLLSSRPDLIPAVNAELFPAG